MKIMLLCGSPRPKESNSLYLLEGLKSHLNPENSIVLHRVQTDATGLWESILPDIWDSDRIVFAFPLYVDGIPSHFLGLLHAIEQQGKQARGRVYTIVNNGFYEARQNLPAIGMVWNWCARCGLEKGRALAVGAGEMAQAAPLGHGPAANLGKALERFAQDVQNGATGDPVFVEPNFPRFLYQKAGHLGMRRLAKKNGLSDKEVRRKLEREGNE